MTDPAHCPHEDTVPVEVRSPITGVTEVVALVCTACMCQLHPGWGCPNCEWDTAEIRRLCDPMPELIQTLIRPCQEHA